MMHESFTLHTQRLLFTLLEQDMNMITLKCIIIIYEHNDLVKQVVTS